MLNIKAFLLVNNMELIIYRFNNPSYDNRNISKFDFLICEYYVPSILDLNLKFPNFDLNQIKINYSSIVIVKIIIVMD